MLSYTRSSSTAVPVRARSKYTSVKFAVPRTGTCFYRSTIARPYSHTVAQCSSTDGRTRPASEARPGRISAQSAVAVAFNCVQQAWQQHKDAPKPTEDPGPEKFGKGSPSRQCCSSRDSGNAQPPLLPRPDDHAGAQARQRRCNPLKGMEGVPFHA